MYVHNGTVAYSEFIGNIYIVCTQSKGSGNLWNLVLASVSMYLDIPYVKRSPVSPVIVSFIDLYVLNWFYLYL